MEYYVIPLVLGVGVLLLLWSAWELWCNDRTYRQRLHLLSLVPPGHPQFWELFRMFNVVDYDSHLWALMTLRSPWRLYPQPVQDLVRSTLRK